VSIEAERAQEGGAIGEGLKKKFEPATEATCTPARSGRTGYRRRRPTSSSTYSVKQPAPAEIRQEGGKTELEQSR
jgi:hypothetical protein